MPAIVCNLKSRENSTDIYDEDFFGPVYCFDQASFEFTPGDRVQIEEIVAYVKSICSDPNKGPKYFALNKSQKIKPSYQNVGRYFGKPLSCIPQNRLPQDDESLKQQLFANACKILRKKSVSIEKMQLFTESMVSVVGENDTEITGSIECLFCKLINVPRLPISVQKKVTGNPPKIYWNVSNFAKHVDTHMKNSNKKTPKLKPTMNEFDTPLDKSLFESIIEEDHSERNIENVDDDIGIEENAESDADNDNSYTIGLEIKPIDNLSFSSNDLQALVYTQISKQMVRMNETALKYNEKEFDMMFLMKNEHHTLHLTKIKMDGNCLYGSLVHQLFRTKIDSRKHTTEIKKLRTNVISHINEYSNDFEHELKGSAIEYYGRDYIKQQFSDYQTASTDFLNNVLPQNGTWGGSETMKAVSRMMSVNILVINENGDFDFARDFNLQFKNTVILAFGTFLANKNDSRESNAVNIPNTERDHYNSVIRLEQSDIFIMSKELASIISTKEKTAKTHGTIEINDTI